MNNTQKIFFIYTIIMSNFFSCGAYCHNAKYFYETKIYDTYHQKKHQFPYKPYNKKYRKYINKMIANQIAASNIQNIYPFISNNISEIQISDHSLQLRNIYMKSYNQLVFHQLGYQFMNNKKIYNFGLGYRHCCCDQWVIGNNIFYDTLLSTNKKIVSIGYEFLKYPMHITINTYHNLSNDSFICTKNTKFLPFSYDLYIKNHLPFFMNSYGKINIEYFFKNKYNKHITPSQNTENTINSYYINNNKYKLALGLSYTPIEMFTFNIDKIFLNSIKTYETKFNILANYKIGIPWIYQKNNLHDKSINYMKIWTIGNHTCRIYKNHSILFNKYENVSLNTTNIKNTHTNTKKQLNKKLETISCSLKTCDISNSDNKKNISPHRSYDLNHELSEEILPTIKESCNNLELYDQTQTHLGNHTTIHGIDTKKDNNGISINNNEISLQKINYDDHNDQTISLSNISNSDTSSLKTISQPLTLQTKPQEEKIHDIHINPNIPPPPPLLEDNFINKIHSNYNILTTKIDNSNRDTSNNSDINNSNNLKCDTIRTVITKHKNNKFSSLGSEEHLRKLNNISKRKKTISTSSNESNDSESIRLLKIIERQSILTMNRDDTDSDEQNSGASDEFSE